MPCSQVYSYLSVLHVHVLKCTYTSMYSLLSVLAHVQRVHSSRNRLSRIVRILTVPVCARESPVVRASSAPVLQLNTQYKMFAFITYTYTLRSQIGLSTR